MSCFKQASIIRTLVGFFTLFVSYNSNPLKIRVDQRPDLGGPILRLPVDSEDINVTPGTFCDPLTLTKTYIAYCREQRARLRKILGRAELNQKEKTIKQIKITVMKPQQPPGTKAPQIQWQLFDNATTCAGVFIREKIITLRDDQTFQIRPYIKRKP